MLQNLFLLLVAVWFFSELALIATRKTSGISPRSLGRGSVSVIWIVLAASSFAAYGSSFLGVLPLPLPRSVLWAAADAVVALGMVIRGTAIVTLGRFFSVDVVVRDDHAIVDRGLYCRVRHPAYLGILVSFLGLGIAFGNWLGLALATIPPAAVLIDRIRVEEAALLAELGEPYRAYCARTQRLLPGLY